MEYKAIRTFLHGGVVYEEGQVVDIHPTEAKFLLATKRVVEVEAGEVDYDALTKEALVKLAEDKGIVVKPTMKKSEIVDALKLEG